MKRSPFPPRDPPQPLANFSSAVVLQQAPFNPIPISWMIEKYAAGLSSRPTPEQLRDWMNTEAPVPLKYHAAIADTIAKMDGGDYMKFRQNCGASIRGIVHLVHETKSFSDRFVHYLDNFSDVGDVRPRWDDDYAGIDCLMRR